MGILAVLVCGSGLRESCCRYTNSLSGWIGLDLRVPLNAWGRRYGVNNAKPQSVMRLRNFRPESASSLTKPHHSCSRPTAYEEGRWLEAIAQAPGGGVAAEETAVGS